MENKDHNVKKPEQNVQPSTSKSTGIPHFAPGGGPKRIIKKFVAIDPNKIKKFGIENMIANALNKLKANQKTSATILNTQHKKQTKPAIQSISSARQEKNKIDDITIKSPTLNSDIKFLLNKKLKEKAEQKLRKEREKKQNLVRNEAINKFEEATTISSSSSNSPGKLVKSVECAVNKISSNNSSKKSYYDDSKTIIITDLGQKKKEKKVSSIDSNLKIDAAAMAIEELRLLDVQRRSSMKRVPSCTITAPPKPVDNVQVCENAINFDFSEMEIDQVPPVQEEEILFEKYIQINADEGVKEVSITCDVVNENKSGSSSNDEFCGFTGKEIEDEQVNIRRLSDLIEKSEENKIIPSFSNLQTYLHQKKSNDAVADKEDSKITSSIKTELDDDIKTRNVQQEEIDEPKKKIPPIRKKAVPVSVLKLSKKGPVVSGKFIKNDSSNQKSSKSAIDLILPNSTSTTCATTSTTTEEATVNQSGEEANNQSNILHSITDLTTDNNRTVVLKIINRDPHSGNIKFEVIDPLIKAENVEDVVKDSSKVVVDSIKLSSTHEQREELTSAETTSNNNINNTILEHQTHEEAINIETKHKDNISTTECDWQNDDIEDNDVDQLDRGEQVLGVITSLIKLEEQKTSAKKEEEPESEKNIKFHDDHFPINQKTFARISTACRTYSFNNSNNTKNEIDNTKTLILEKEPESEKNTEFHDDHFPIKQKTFARMSTSCRTHSFNNSNNAKKEVDNTKTFILEEGPKSEKNTKFHDDHFPIRQKTFARTSTSDRTHSFNSNNTKKEVNNTKTLILEEEPESGQNTKLHDDRFHNKQKTFARMSTSCRTYSFNNSNNTKKEVDNTKTFILEDEPESRKNNSFHDDHFPIKQKTFARMSTSEHTRTHPFNNNNNDNIEIINKAEPIEVVEDAVDFLLSLDNNAINNDQLSDDSLLSDCDSIDFDVMDDILGFPQPQTIKQEIIQTNEIGIEEENYLSSKGYQKDVVAMPLLSPRNTINQQLNQKKYSKINNVCNNDNDDDTDVESPDFEDLSYDNEQNISNENNKVIQQSDLLFDNLKQNDAISYSINDNIDDSTQITQQRKLNNNLKPIVLEDKILSEKERIDIIVLNSCDFLAQNTTTDWTNQSVLIPQQRQNDDNNIIYLDNDLPAKQEIEIVSETNSATKKTNEDILGQTIIVTDDETSFGNVPCGSEVITIDKNVEVNSNDATTLKLGQVISMDLLKVEKNSTNIVADLNTTISINNDKGYTLKHKEKFVDVNLTSKSTESIVHQSEGIQKKNEDVKTEKEKDLLNEQINHNKTDSIPVSKAQNKQEENNNPPKKVIRKKIKPVPKIFSALKAKFNVDKKLTDKSKTLNKSNEISSKTTDTENSIITTNNNQDKAIILDINPEIEKNIDKKVEDTKISLINSEVKVGITAQKLSEETTICPSLSHVKVDDEEKAEEIFICVTNPKVDKKINYNKGEVDSKPSAIQFETLRKDETQVQVILELKDKSQEYEKNLLEISTKTSEDVPSTVKEVIVSKDSNIVDQQESIKQFEIDTNMQVLNAYDSLHVEEKMKEQEGKDVSKEEAITSLHSTEETSHIDTTIIVKTELPKQRIEKPSESELENLEKNAPAEKHDSNIVEPVNSNSESITNATIESTQSSVVQISKETKQYATEIESNQEVISILEVTTSPSPVPEVDYSSKSNKFSQDKLGKPIARIVRPSSRTRMKHEENKVSESIVKDAESKNSKICPKMVEEDKNEIIEILKTENVESATNSNTESITNAKIESTQSSVVQISKETKQYATEIQSNQEVISILEVTTSPSPVPEVDDSSKSNKFTQNKLGKPIARIVRPSSRMRMKHEENKVSESIVKDAESKNSKICPKMVEEDKNEIIEILKTENVESATSCVINKFVEGKQEYPVTETVTIADSEDCSENISQKIAPVYCDANAQNNKLLKNKSNVNLKSISKISSCYLPKKKSQEEKISSDVSSTDVVINHKEDNNCVEPITIETNKKLAPVITEKVLEKNPDPSASKSGRRRPAKRKQEDDPTTSTEANPLPIKRTKIDNSKLNDTSILQLQNYSENGKTRSGRKVKLTQKYLENFNEKRSKRNKKSSEETSEAPLIVLYQNENSTTESSLLEKNLQEQLIILYENEKNEVNENVTVITTNLDNPISENDDEEIISPPKKKRKYVISDDSDNDTATRTTTDTVAKPKDDTLKTPKKDVVKEQPLCVKRLGRKPRNNNDDIKLHPRLLLVENRDELNKEVELPENRPLQKGEVKCGLCKEILHQKLWKKHIATHYGIGWKENIEPPLDIESYRTVFNAMVAYFKNYKPNSMNCKLCGNVFKSGGGVCYHLLSCNASEQEKLDLQIKCEYCERLINKLTYSLHLKKCKAIKDDKQEENQETQEFALNSNDRFKRKSLIRAEQKLKAVTKEVMELEKDSLIKTYLAPRVGMLKKWNHEMKSGKDGRCPGKDCGFSSLDLNELRYHYSNCDKVVWCGFICVQCKFLDADKDVVREHVKSAHELKRSLKFTDSGSEADIGSESSESDVSGSLGNENEKKVKRKKGSKKDHRVRVKPLPVQNDKWKKIYPPHNANTFVQEGRNALQHFRSINYSSSLLFDYAVPSHIDVLPDFKFDIYKPYNDESMQYCYNTTTKCNQHVGSSAGDNFKTLGCFKTEHFQNEKLMFIGGPVTALSWIPLPDNHKESEYLALSYKKDLNHYTLIGSKDKYKTLVLICKIGLAETFQNDIDNPSILYGIPIDTGPVNDIQFLPSGGYAPDANRLGLMAVANCETDINIYSLPLKAPQNCDIISDKFSIFDIAPSLILTLSIKNKWSNSIQLETQCLRMVWSQSKGHNILVAGYANGFVAVWDISEDDNLNRFLENGTRVFLPYKYFSASSKPPTAIDLHYDSFGPRWLAYSNQGRDFSIFDLQDLNTPSLMADDSQRHSVVINWPIYWETLIVGITDDGNQGIGTLNAFSPLNIMYKNRRAVKSTIGVVDVTFNPWKNYCAFGLNNGDILFNLCYDWKHDVGSRTRSERYCTPMDMIRLDGQPMLQYKLQTKEKIPLDLYENDYKSKYAVVFYPVVEVKPEQYKDYCSANRIPVFNLQKFMKVNRIVYNTNKSGGQLVAAGYENGFLRIHKTNF